MAQVLQLSPRFKRGIGHFQNVQGSPQFISLSEIIYVAGQHLVIEHVESKLQLRFIALPHHGSSLLCVSLIKGQYAAISFSNENPCIGLWNLKESSDKVEMIHVGTDVQCMCFSCDGKYIVYVVKESDHPKVAIWDIELRKNGKNPYSLNDVGSNVYLISANPIEALCFALGGLELLRIVNYSELSESWESMDYNLSPDLAVLSLVWLNYNTLLVGSNDGTLLVADSKQIKARYEALTLDNLDISLKRNPHMSTNVKQRQHCFRHVDLKWSPCYVAISDHAVLSIATYHEGFALVCLPNFIILMKQGSENKFFRIHRFTLCPDNIPSNDYDLLKIVHITFNHSTVPTLICATEVGQMYISREIGVLTQLGPKVHYKAITGVDMSWHKNRVVSVSEDRQLCVWNAKTGESELCEKYNMDVIGVTMDQTGFYLYIGFSHKVNFCMLRYKTLTMKRSFDLMPCSRIRFSVTGSYVALVNNLDVLVLDNIYFEPVHVLSGNTSRITKLAWSYKDDYLVSCAADGSIIQWKLSTEDRRKCLTLENVKFVDIALSFCRDVLVAVGNSPYIYTLDLGSMEVARILAWQSFVYISSVCLAYSDRFLFVGGNDGKLLSVMNPLTSEEPRNRTLHPAHRTDISEIKISPGNDMLVTGTIRGTLAFWSIHMEGATRIKVPIPVTLIEKHVLMSYVKTIEEFTITLNNIHFVFDKKMNLLERSLANEYEEERKQYEAETKRKQRHLSQLVRCNNKERSALKTELRTLKNNNRSRRERLQIEFCEEFVQQALKVKQLQLEIQLGSQQYERKREQIMEHFEQEKNKEMRMFNLEQDKKKTYMNHLQSQLTKFNSGNIYVDKEVKKLDKFYSHLIDEKRFKNYEIEVGVEKLLRDKKHEYNDLVANIYVLTGDLKALYEQKVLVDQQTAPYVWSLKEMEHFISVSDKDENMIVEPNRDYEQAIDIYEAKCQSLESCLRDKDRIIREKRDELQVLEDKVLQIQDRLLSKIRKQFQLKDCLAEVSNKLIPSHKKLVHLESEIDSTLQDLSDMLFKPPKLSQKCNDPQDFHRRDILKNYKNEMTSPSLSMVSIEMNKEFTENKNFVKEKIDQLKSQIDYLNGDRRANKEYLMKKSVEVINDNENLRHVIDDTNKKITKFMYRAGLNNPCNSDKQLHAFLETADDIQNQYSRRVIQLETEIDVLKQQKKMAKDILKEIKF